MDGSLREAYQRGLSKIGLRSIKNHIMTYAISTSKGQSGTGVITGVRKNVMVAIHLAGPE